VSSPTARSLEYLRDRGWIARVVEKWIPFRKIRLDCFGGDVLAIHPASKRTMLIQATSDSNHSSRKLKSMKNDEVRYWLTTGNEFEVWSWKKGKKEPRREKLELSGLQDAGEVRECSPTGART